MSFFGELDKQLQAGLIAFVAEQEAKPYPHTFGESLTADILRHFINGDCRMSGCATNHAKKTMYLEFTFYEEDVNGIDNEALV